MKGRESQCSVYYCIFFLIPLLSLLFSSLLYSPFPFPVIYLVFPFFFFSSSFFSLFLPLVFFLLLLLSISLLFLALPTHPSSSYLHLFPYLTCIYLLSTSSLHLLQPPFLSLLNFSTSSLPCLLILFYHLYLISLPYLPFTFLSTSSLQLLQPSVSSPNLLPAQPYTYKSSISSPSSFSSLTFYQVFRPFPSLLLFPSSPSLSDPGAAWRPCSFG